MPTVIGETVPIPNTEVKLLYHNRTRAFYFSVFRQLGSEKCEIKNHLLYGWEIKTLCTEILCRVILLNQVK